MSFPRYLQDHFGRTYRIEFARSREFWTIRVWDHGLPVAYLYAWHVRGERLRVQDFKVADDLQVPMPLWQHLLRKLLGLRPRVVSYRCRGIATALLATLVAHAEAEGVPRIEGDIVERDRAQFPGLPDWYRARGFSLHQDIHGLHFHRNLSSVATASNL